MTSERIKEIQATTGYPDSVSIKQALLQVWNECEQSHPSPMSAADMTAREYFDGEGSPLTLSKICNDEEKEFLLQHIELYASGKVHQSKQPPMSAEQYDLQKLYDWIMDENRKPSITAFTSSIARNIASEFEFRLSKHKSAMSAEQVDWRQVIKDRVKHFNSIFHSYEARQLVGALYAIDQLVPPSHFATSPPAKPMSAEQVEELGYYYPLFKFFSDEHGLSLLDSQLQDVIHECKKFIEPSTTGESWKAEYDNCRALLQELVSLKVMRENLYKGNPDGKEYAERKPKAWQAAQQFLLTYQHEGFATTPSVKADGWVSVEDELPKVGQKVDLWLVPDDEEKSYRMTWTWEKESTARITINGCKVTHWQPFTPPKQHLQTITSK